MLSVVCAFSSGTGYITKVVYFSIPNCRAVFSNIKCDSNIRSSEGCYVGVTDVKQVQM